MRKQVFAMSLLLVMMVSGCAKDLAAPAEKKESVAEAGTTADEKDADSMFPSESKQEEALMESEVPEETESQESMDAPEVETDAEEGTQPSAEARPKLREPAAAAATKESGQPAAALSSESKQPAAETASVPAEQSQAAQQQSQETQPQETQPQEETMPAQPTAPPEETEPKTAYDFPFDIGAVKADCIGIGQGMGLALDSSLTPDNATWWNPVTASQNNQGEALKQSLVSYITFHTAANLGAYGMDGITVFNIYCEARGNGVYSVYFLFA